MRYLIGALLALLLCAGVWGAVEHNWRIAAEAERDACHSASADAVAAQEAMRAREKAQAKEQADAGDDRYAALLAAFRRDTARHVAVQRMQPQADSSPSEPVDQAGGAGVPESLPAGEPVMVDSADVQRAAEWQAFGLACRDWALSVGQ
jgi:hypothetical protein